jgi:hypothetical protein
MQNLEAIQILYTLLQASKTISNNLIFTLDSQKTIGIKSLLKDNGIQISDIQAPDDIKIEGDFFVNNKIIVRSSFDHFYRLFDATSYQENTIAILDYSKKDIILSKIENEVLSSTYFQSKIISSEVNNFYYLKKIINEFLHIIADYHDTLKRNYVFLSPENGRLVYCLDDI